MLSLTKKIRLIKFIESKKSGKIILGLFILTNIIYIYMLMVTIPKTTEFSNGIKLLDMIYPLLFGLSYCFIFASFLKKLQKLNTPFSYLCLLPLIAGIADCLENFGIITILNNYPDLTSTTLNTTNTFSVLKSTSTSIYFIALMVILIIFGIKFMKRNKTSANIV